MFPKKTNQAMVTAVGLRCSVLIMETLTTTNIVLD